jgi:hypothetical protein
MSARFRPREVISVPSVWYRCASCSLERVKPRSQWVKDRLNSFGVDLSEGVWTFVFGGPVSEYKPTQEVLDLAINLPMSEEDAEPGEEWIQFFQQWGPFGLSRIMPLSNDLDTWRFYHRPGTERPKQSFHCADEFENYVEYWPLVHRKLMDLWWAEKTPSPGERADLYNKYVKRELHYDEDRPYHLRTYDSLFGALVDLAVERSISEELLSECLWCKENFWTADSTQKFCKPTCREAYHLIKADELRKSDPLVKEKRRLKSRLDRRKDLIGTLGLKEQHIRNAINDAKSDKALDDVKRKYKSVFADLPKGPPPFKGRAEK